MSDKFDLACMLREISEETEAKSTKSRALSQEDIKRLLAEKNKSAAAATAHAEKSHP